MSKGVVDRRTISKYTDEDRRRAVVELHTLGNIEAVARSINIPATTLHDWVRSDWFNEISVEVREQIGEQILAQNLAIATKAGNAVLDRLEHGDHKLVKNKNGYETTRVPMNGKDAAVISGITQDKARVQMGLATSISKTADMSDLAKQFQALSEQWAEKQARVIDEQ